MANDTTITRDQGTNRLRPAIWGGAALLLLAPLAEMQFTQQVVWNATDFAVFGLMLVVACGAYELSTRIMSTRRTRAVAGFTIIAAFLLTWVELAVGIFD